jgi:hypothetical protein
MQIHHSRLGHFWLFLVLSIKYNVFVALETVIKLICIQYGCTMYSKNWHSHSTCGRKKFGRLSDVCNIPATELEICVQSRLVQDAFHRVQAGVYSSRENLRYGTTKKAFAC